MQPGVHVGGGQHVVIPSDWKERILRGQPVPGCNYALGAEPQNQAAPMINVVERFNLDTSGATDLTADMQRVYAGTALNDTLFFPPYRYPIRPDALRWGNRKLVGARTSSTMGAHFFALTPGTNLLECFNFIAIDGLQFDCAGKCGTGLYANKINGSIDHVRVTGATDWGIVWQEGLTSSVDCVVTSSAKGHYLLGPSGSVFVALRAFNCPGPGLRIHGAAALPQPTVQSGVCHILGITIDACGSDNASHSIEVLGWEGGTLAGDYIEVRGLNGNVSSIYVGGGTHGCNFDGLFMSGTAGQNAHIEVGDAQGCTFTGHTMGSGGLGATILCTDPDNFWNNEFFGNNQNSRVVPSPAKVKLTDGVTSYTYTPRGGELTALGPPTLGHWDKGRRMWSESGNGGWRCDVQGIPGTWVAF